MSDRTIEHISCPDSEKDFLASLPGLLILLSACRSDLCLVLGDNKLTGLTTEPPVPGLPVAIDHESALVQAQKRASSKKRVCAGVGVDYCVVPYDDTPYTTEKNNCDLFQKHHVFLSSNLNLHITYARK